MTSEGPAVVRTIRVGKWSATVTLAKPKLGQVSHAIVEWSPDVPDQLSEVEFRQYQAGLMDAVGDLLEPLAADERDSGAGGS
jgi:hypothetical protein